MPRTDERTITLRVSKTEHAAIREAAWRRRMSMNQFLRMVARIASGPISHEEESQDASGNNPQADDA